MLVGLGTGGSVLLSMMVGVGVDGGIETVGRGSIVVGVASVGVTTTVTTTSLLVGIGGVERLEIVSIGIGGRIMTVVVCIGGGESSVGKSSLGGDRLSAVVVGSDVIAGSVLIASVGESGVTLPLSGVSTGEGTLPVSMLELVGAGSG